MQTPLMNQEGNPRRREANQCGLVSRQKGIPKTRCAKSYINVVGASGPPRNSELSLLARRLERSGNKFRTLRNSSTVDLRLGSTVLNSGLVSHTSFSHIVDLRMTGDHHASRWTMDDGTHRRTTVRSSLCISWPSKFTTFSCEQLASRLASHPNFLVRLGTHSSTLPLTGPLVLGTVVVGSLLVVEAGP